MLDHRLAALLAWALLTCPLLAQESPQEIAPTTQPSQIGTDPWWKAWMKCQNMTGSWGGLRDQLAEKGITFNIDLVQVMQENVHGGHRTNDALKYMAKGDLTLTIDTQKLGLWDGGLFLLNAEPRWGRGVNRHVGSLMPVNFNALKPTAEEDDVMALSEWIYFQNFFKNKVTLIMGKLDGSRAFDRNAFANDERTQFMNLALRNNPMIGAFLPYTNLGVGLALNPVDWLSVVTAVADAEGKATETGFNTAFHGPTHTSVIHEWAFKIKPFGLPGTQRVGFIWTSKEFQHLSPVSPFAETGPLMINLLGPKLANRVVHMVAPFNTSPDNVAVYYNFDQYLWTKKCDPTQGVGVFGRFGWERDDVNPISTFYSFGVGGKGVIPDREKDTFGVGWYHLDLSDDLPNIFTEEDGVEIFYNIEICPWLHITPDIQIIADPGGVEHGPENAFVWGIRMYMNL